MSNLNSVSTLTNIKSTLTEIEAAEYLGLSRATLRRARMQGARSSYISSPPFLKIGRAIRYLKSDLDKWLEQHRVVPGTPRPQGPEAA
jgi:predicted DNA-binding transcriptional regulator AlpA